MFASLPNSVEVLKAKEELFSMMEDKYNELIAEGRPDNEAVGIVLSEFGNLDEVAESIGISRTVFETEPEMRTLVTYEQADFYIGQMMRHRLILGFGVMLTICSPIGVILSAINERINETVGVALLLLFVAAGVGCIIYSASIMKPWSYIEETPCYIDYVTSDHVRIMFETGRSQKTMLLIMGICLCILSILPTVIFSGISASYILTEGIGPAMLLFMIGMGVMLIIYAGGKTEAAERLLKLNDADTVSGQYNKGHEAPERYDNPVVDSFMEHYWTVVTCGYLIYSFLTFNWHISWVIWPVAAILKSVIRSIWGSREETL